MASGNSSGLGSSLFRGALHGSTSNSGSGSLSTSATANNSNTHHNNHLHHHHPHHHSHHNTTTHHLQQGSVAGNSHLHHNQPTSSSQPQPSIGPVWFTPKDNGHGNIGSTSSPNHMSTLMAKLWFDNNVESSLSSLKKEEHEKRMRDLRKELDYIADTDWKYSPVEKYIGKQ